MPLVNALPIGVFPGNPWSASAPQQAQELITTYNLDELDALNAPPDPDLAWAEIGSHTSVGTGIVKVMHRMPQSLAFEKFKYGGTRDYHSMDAIATRIQVNPFDLNFGIPMIWDEIGNGWKLMSTAPDGSLTDFIGINGLAPDYVLAGKAYKCQLLASLFYSGLYSTALSLTAPTALAYGGAAMPNNPNGLALFSDGLGAEGTLNAKHYANPTVAGSGRFANVFPAFGSFSDNFGTSLRKMAEKPHPTLPNVTSGARVTDVFGPTHMRDRFWRMMIQTLTLQSASLGGSAVGAATTNPYSQAVANGMSEDNFIGSAFGPRRFWIVPQLDNHPYVQAHLTDGPAGEPADFWINVSAKKGRASWAKLASNSREFVPTFRMYGPGDPRAMSERRMRWEGDLDGGVSGGAPGEVDMFMGV